MFCVICIDFFIDLLFFYISFASKSVFGTKFACANLAAKFFAVELLNPEVVMYLS